MLESLWLNLARETARETRHHLGYRNRPLAVAADTAAPSRTIARARQWSQVARRKLVRFLGELPHAFDHSSFWKLSPTASRSATVAKRTKA